MQWIQAMLDCQKFTYHDASSPSDGNSFLERCFPKQNLKKGFTPSTVQTS
jgi:hypothetical protein